MCTDVLMLLCSALSHPQTVNPHSAGMLAALTNTHTVHSLVKHPRGLRKKTGSSIRVSTTSKLQHRSLWSNLWHNDSFVTAVDMFSALQMVPEIFLWCINCTFNTLNRIKFIQIVIVFKYVNAFYLFRGILVHCEIPTDPCSTSSNLIRKMAAIRKWSQEFKVEMSQTCTL